MLQQPNIMVRCSRYILSIVTTLSWRLDDWISNFLILNLLTLFFSRLFVCQEIKILQMSSYHALIWVLLAYLYCFLYYLCCVLYCLESEIIGKSNQSSILTVCYEVTGNAICILNFFSEMSHQRLNAWLSIYFN